MGGKFDQAKGRAKEAIGVLTDDEAMRRQGRRDRVAGTVKEKANKAVDKARKAVE